MSPRFLLSIPHDLPLTKHVQLLPSFFSFFYIDNFLALTSLPEPLCALARSPLTSSVYSMDVLLKDSTGRVITVCQVTIDGSTFVALGAYAQANPSRVSDSQKILQATNIDSPHDITVIRLPGLFKTAAPWLPFGDIRTNADPPWHLKLGEPVQASIIAGVWTIPPQWAIQAEGDIDRASKLIDKIRREVRLLHSHVRPLPLVPFALRRPFENRFEAELAGALAKYVQWEHIAFLTWFVAAYPEWRFKLRRGTVNDISDYKLQDVKKRGVILRPESEWRIMNLRFLVMNEVPVWLEWTEEMVNQPQWTLINPRVYDLYHTAAAKRKRTRLNLSDIYSLSPFAAALRDYDHHFQLQRRVDVGRLSDISVNLDRDECTAQDFEGWKPRPIERRLIMYYKRTSRFVLGPARSTTSKIIRFTPYEPLILPSGHPAIQVVENWRQTMRATRDDRLFAELKEFYRYHYAPLPGEAYDTLTGLRTTGVPVEETDSTAFPPYFWVNLEEESDDRDGDGYFAVVNQSIQWPEDLGDQSADQIPEDPGLSFAWDNSIRVTPSPSVEDSEPVSEFDGPPPSLLSRISGILPSPTPSDKRSQSPSSSSVNSPEEDRRGPHDDGASRPFGTKKVDPTFPQNPRSKHPVPWFKGIRPSYIIREMGRGNPPGREERAFASMPHFFNLTVNWTANCVGGWNHLYLAGADGEWNTYWMSEGIFRAPPTSMTILKAWANVYPSHRHMGDLLVQAMQANIPFNIVYPIHFLVQHQSQMGQADVRSRYTHGRNLELGYVEAPLPHGLTFGNFKTHWLARIADVTQRPHFRGIVAEGSVYTWIVAQWVGWSLWKDFMSGPSETLTRHLLGGQDSREIPAGTICKWDQITDDEKAILIGRVNHSMGYTSVYPSHEVLLEAWFFTTGIWNKQCDRFMSFVSSKVEEGRWELRSPKEWNALFRTMGNMETYQMSHVPTTNDQTWGEELIMCGFPRSWNGARIDDIQLPEPFEYDMQK